MKNIINSHVGVGTFNCLNASKFNIFLCIAEDNFSALAGATCTIHRFTKFSMSLLASCWLYVSLFSFKNGELAKKNNTTNCLPQNANITLTLTCVEIYPLAKEMFY